jgi:hypothetical protein
MMRGSISEINNLDKARLTERLSVFELALADQRFSAENQPYCDNPFDNRDNASQESIELA